MLPISQANGMAPCARSIAAGEHQRGETARDHRNQVSPTHPAGAERKHGDGRRVLKAADKGESEQRAADRQMPRRRTAGHQQRRRHDQRCRQRLAQCVRREQDQLEPDCRSERRDDGMGSRNPCTKEPGADHDRQ
ncbi:hypothetical protein ACVIHI_007242 [Bradyrhizobium sp. USDA 4524]